VLRVYRHASAIRVKFPSPANSESLAKKIVKQTIKSKSDFPFCAEPFTGRNLWSCHLIVKTKTKRAHSSSNPRPVRDVAVADDNGHASGAHAVVALKDRRLNFGIRWDYAPAPESFDYIKVPARHDLFIGGKFLVPHWGRYFESLNPATEEKLSEIAEGGAEDINSAVKAARRAYEKVWSRMPGRERGKFLYRIARIIQEKARELAVLETMDGGKPIKESRDVDLPLVAAHFFYYAGWADKLNYAFPGRKAEPLGVAGQIIPWNFPLLMAAWKIAPALACGNTVVLKPAETTSITAMQLARIFQEAELPDGVVNIVTGAGATGAALVNHPDIDKIAFTGSTEVGKLIAKKLTERNAGARVPRLTLELGGKAANIVFEDAPIDQAIEGVIAGIYFNQGHVCCAGSRLFVQEGIYPTIIRKLRDRIRTLRVGNPLDKNTDIGAINSRPQLEKIRGLVQSGIDEGAEVEQAQCTLPARGYWYPPTFLTGVTMANRVAQEEIFGPVLSVMTFRTPEEAFERANNTPYGLSAGVWTDKGSKIFKMVNKLRAGVVWANTYNKFDPTSPFGGYKESGFGREGGVQGLLGYLRLS
jgi:aldehyde dehydrogenase (NAD+)